MLIMSLSSGERGLKFLMAQRLQVWESVALFGRAWIEIAEYFKNGKVILCRSLRESVD